MDFSIDIAEFPSAVHAGIYSIARNIIPARRSLIYIDDAAMRASCEAYLGFYVEMLSDMYDHPDAYSLPALALENYLGGKKQNGMKQKFPSKTKNIIALTRNAARGYVHLLCLLGQKGEVDRDTLIISPEGRAEVAKRTKTPVSPLSLETRLEALKRVGLTEKNGGFVSEKYPHMFPAMRALTLKAEKLSGFNFHAFITADFRNLGLNHRASHEDYFDALIAPQREAAYALHNIALENGLRPVIDRGKFYKVDYKYKGAEVMMLSTEGDCASQLEVRLTCAYGWDDQSLINQRLGEEPKAFQKEVLRHVWRCDACSTSHLGRFVTLLGKRQRVCGGGSIAFRWHNPADGDVIMIEKLIGIRRALIDELKAAK